MEDSIASLVVVSELHILSWYVWSMGLYSFFRWQRSQIACGCTGAIWFTWMLSHCVATRLLDFILAVITAATYRHLLSVHSMCHTICYGSCASIYIIDVSRDWIVKTILEINQTVRKTVAKIPIFSTTEKATGAINLLTWPNTTLKFCYDAMTLLNALKYGGRLLISGCNSLWRTCRRIGVWHPSSETNFTFCRCANIPIFLALYLSTSPILQRCAALM